MAKETMLSSLPGVSTLTSVLAACAEALGCSTMISVSCSDCMTLSSDVGPSISMPIFSRSLVCVVEPCPGSLFFSKQSCASSPASAGSNYTVCRKMVMQTSAFSLTYVIPNACAMETSFHALLQLAASRTPFVFRAGPILTQVRSLVGPISTCAAAAAAAGVVIVIAMPQVYLELFQVQVGIGFRDHLPVASSHRTQRLPIYTVLVARLAVDLA